MAFTEELSPSTPLVHKVQASGMCVEYCAGLIRAHENASGSHSEGLGEIAKRLQVKSALHNTNVICRSFQSAINGNERKLPNELALYGLMKRIAGSEDTHGALKELLLYCCEVKGVLYK